MMMHDPREMAPATYKSKPVEITAVRFMGGMNLGTVMAFLGDQFEAFQENEETGKSRVLMLNSHKHADVLGVDEGDWIIKGMENEFYPCVDSVFRKKYGAS